MKYVSLSYLISKKRIFSLALAFVLTLGALTGCKADREEVASADSTTTTLKPVEADPTDTDYSMFEKVSGAAVPYTAINSIKQTFIKYTYAKKYLNS